MKSKLTIALAVLLLAILAMPESAKAQGWNVTRPAEVPTVIFGGNNQQVSHIDFVDDTADTAAIPEVDGAVGTTITVKYGDMMITSSTRATQALAIVGTTTPTDNFNLWCSTNYQDASPTFAMCEGDNGPRATIANDDDGKGSVTITFPAGYTVTANNATRLAYVRLDVSGLVDKAEVPISITRGAGASVPLGGGVASGSVSGVVGVVAMGLTVEAAPAAGLACAGAQALPTITVAEGFKGAWSPKAMYVDDIGAGQMPMSPMIKIMVNDFPDGGKIVWTDSVNATAEVNKVKDTVIGTLTLVEASSKANGQEAVYSYTPHEAIPDDADTGDVDESVSANDPGNTILRSVKIPVKEHELSGNQALSVTAMLYPMAELNAKGEKTELMTKLSFSGPAVDPKDGKGENWLVLSECVTYLLYPFITCGATDGWSTGISVANTSADGNVFGAFDKADEGSGPVVMYGFPKGQARPAEGISVEPVVTTISSNLMAGDTTTFSCANTTMAGMEGYAIIKASFQHAEGMAFVMGNFDGVAGIDVTHGYVAKVITDPVAQRNKKIE
jgi:hypothetical protein